MVIKKKNTRKRSMQIKLPKRKEKREAMKSKKIEGTVELGLFFFL